MTAYRPDRVVRLLYMLVSIACFLLWITAILVLVVAPAARLLTRDQPGWTWTMGLPAVVHGSDASVVTSWGAARFVVDRVRGDLVLPVSLMPWWLLVLVWTHALIGVGLLLLIFHHLRRIVRRVRDGMPFDVQNAIWMRRIGLLFLGLTLFNGLARLATAMAVRKDVVSSTIKVGGGVDLDLGNICIAVVVIALAEVFRRGAELEHEQSLVI